ncbi:MAG: Rieske (2Fe-2S) protein [bacterium]
MQDENHPPTLATTHDFVATSRRVVYFKQKEIVIFKVNGEFFAVDNLCPHRQAALSTGEVADGVVTCPWHGARFDLKTGKGLEGPHQADLGCYQVYVEGTAIKLARIP